MMEDLTLEEKLAIRNYFDDPNYPQPHGEVIATQLLSAMIASGKYELEEYPRLAESAVRLTTLLAVRFHREMSREVKETITPKPATAEGFMNSDPTGYDPIPF